MKTLIIAEAGINHNRDMSIALHLIDAAKQAGADVVKFQLEIGGDYCPSFDQMKKLYLYCLSGGMKFACTAFDVESLEFLLENTEMDFVKIASRCTDKKLLALAGKSKLPIILSTGKSSLDDVRWSIENIIGERYTDQPLNMTLLHCISAYPAPYDQTNLRAIELMRKYFLLPVGFSDHSLGIELPIAATAMGAVAVEKHLTLNRTMTGPDHVCSAEPDEFEAMVKAIRNVERAFGNEIKCAQRCEI